MCFRFDDLLRGGRFEAASFEKVAVQAGDGASVKRLLRSPITIEPLMVVELESR